MRPEFDSEIDSVLRGHARRGGASPVAWGAGASISREAASGSHLDADEIAAFGEGALPQAARARYSAHLADCDDCRRSVTQVALAAGVADRIEESERGGAAVAAAAAATQSPSWRERLASLFAPRAWRYAMPVVALVAVSAVVLVVMRRAPREGLTEMAARRGGAEQQNRAPSAAPEAHHADATQPQPPAPAGAQSANTATTGVAPTTGEDKDSGAADQFAKLSPKAVEGTGSSTVGRTAGSASAARAEVAQPVQAEPPPPTQSYVTAASPSPLPPAAAPAQRSVVLRDIAAATPTPAPPRPTEAEARERTREDSRAAAAAPRDEATPTKRHGPQRGLGGRSAELSAADQSKDDRASAARPARGPAKNESNRNEPAEAKAKREEDGERQQQQAETRTVGGRRFRREGNVWIDTAYRSSQATVVVRRDSEQYRALVADEPEIGRISRALGGEAVIVWKGRAYRVKP